ncbi:dihydrodipicolinate synthase family protein, partial [Amycolatopsis sp. NPDC059021]|uniref:dihydrodipicolinate synthase family protein n=1 Tax=Amycolatopsis sp. NPDC059021 TaxID=3346704 RepID=UPI00366EA14B
MAQPKIELDGLLAFPLTPFTEDLELNLDAFAENVESHVAAGAGAVFVACGTGELSSLSPAEHAAVLAKAREVAGGRVPVWVGAGGGPARARAPAAPPPPGGGARPATTSPPPTRPG